MSRVFQSMFPGRCGGCGSPFPAGSLIFYGEGDREPILEQCCGDIPEGADPRPDKVHEVMPRGKSKKDKCPRCFQIPSSNNSCGCD